MLQDMGRELSGPMILAFDQGNPVRMEASAIHMWIHDKKYRAAKIAASMAFNSSKLLGY